MRWDFKYTASFAAKARALPQTYQKAYVHDFLIHLKTLDDPKDMGGPYLNGWAYFFCGRSLLLCDIDYISMTVVFYDIVL